MMSESLSTRAIGKKDENGLSAVIFGDKMDGDNECSDLEYESVSEMSILNSDHDSEGEGVPFADGISGDSKNDIDRIITENKQRKRSGDSSSPVSSSEGGSPRLKWMDPNKKWKMPQRVGGYIKCETNYYDFQSLNSSIHAEYQRVSQETQSETEERESSSVPYFEAPEGGFMAHQRRTELTDFCDPLQSEEVFVDSEQPPSDDDRMPPNGCELENDTDSEEEVPDTEDDGTGAVSQNATAFYTTVPFPIWAAPKLNQMGPYHYDADIESDDASPLMVEHCEHPSQFIVNDHEIMEDEKDDEEASDISSPIVSDSHHQCSDSDGYESDKSSADNDAESQVDFKLERMNKEKKAADDRALAFYEDIPFDKWVCNRDGTTVNRRGDEIDNNNNNDNGVNELDRLGPMGALDENDPMKLTMMNTHNRRNEPMVDHQYQIAEHM